MVDQSPEPSRKLDRELHVALGRDKTSRKIPQYTSSNDAIDKLMAEALPGFWETSGLCVLTGHASLGADYNGPHAELQQSAWPEAEFGDGFHADLGPEGGGDHRKCLARLHCILQALIARRSQG